MNSEQNPTPVCAIAMTTCGTRADADAIAQQLVENGLAACVQIFPIDSTYKWQGAVEKAQEFMLLCKIKSADYAAVEAAIRALHPYDVPEIVEIAIAGGLPAYLQWIASVTR